MPILRPPFVWRQLVCLPGAAVLCPVLLSAQEPPPAPLLQAPGEPPSPGQGTREVAWLDSVGGLLALSPSAGFQDANSRGGAGGFIGFQFRLGTAGLRLSAETEAIGGQLLEDGSGTRSLDTRSIGVTYLRYLRPGLDTTFYLLGGAYLDRIEQTVRSGGSAVDFRDNGNHLGLRVGAGLSLGTAAFLEAKYRVTFGESLFAPARGGAGSGLAWSAFELGVGFRFKVFR